MYQRILVAIDKSEIGQQVVNAAISLAASTGGTLNLLHVLSYEDEHAPGLKEKGTPEYQKRWDEFEKDGIQLLKEQFQQVTNAGISTVYSLVSGKPGRVICDVARSWGADTILIGRRQISSFKELILGSVSNYVVHSAQCSVLVIQN